MSGCVNKAIVIGNLGHDVSLRQSDGNRRVASFSLATNEVWKDAKGQRQEETTWHQVVVFGDQAEACHKYLAKGRSVCVEGRMSLRKWTGKDGTEKSRTEIVASRVTFLGGSDGPSVNPRSGATHREERFDPQPQRKPGDPLPGDEGVPF